MDDQSKAALYNNYLTEPNMVSAEIVPGKKMDGMIYSNISQHEVKGSI